MTVPVFPEFYRSLPSWTEQFTGSIISMAVVVSVPLNALFLLGTWHYSLLRLGTVSTLSTARSFDVFFEKQAKEWKIPAEDAARVRSVVDTAISKGEQHGPANSAPIARSRQRAGADGHRSRNRLPSPHFRLRRSATHGR